MSQAAKTTLGASIVATKCIIAGVHYLQVKERETMYKGVQRDDERDREKKQRMVNLQENRERESRYLELQPQSSPSSGLTRLA